MRLAATLLLLFESASPALAQFDAYSWNLTGCATLSGDKISMKVCAGGCSGSFGKATLAAPATGSYAMDLSWFTADDCCSYLDVNVAGKKVYGIKGFGSWCYPGSPPCMGGASVGFHAKAGDPIELHLYNVACIGVVTSADFTHLIFTPAPAPILSSVTPKPAWKPALVTIAGSNFVGDCAVTIGGVAQPIISQTMTALVVRPDAGDPGFADVTVTNAAGSATAANALASLPALEGKAQAAGASVNLTFDLRSVGGGGYTLLAGRANVATPIPSGPQVYYGLLLDPSSVTSVAAGSVPPSGELQITLTVPAIPALSGTTIHFQGIVEIPPTGIPLRASYTNLVGVVLP